MKRIALLAALFVIVLFSQAFAIVNPGFESSLTGWTVNNAGLSSVVSSHPTGYPYYNTYSPMEGNWFLSLTGGYVDVYTTASQSLALNAGDILSGWAALDAHDYLPFQDDAYVRVLDAAGFPTVLWSSNTQAVGDYGDGPWTAWSWTALNQGTYTLEYGVRNTLDSGLSPHALFDAQASVVPEPASMALLGLGLAGLALRRRKAA